MFAYATDPSRCSEWQTGVIDGSMEAPGPPVGARFERVNFFGDPLTWAFLAAA